MKTSVNYKVINTINDEISFFDTLEQVENYVKSEINWFSSKKEIENNTGYNEDDFIIDKLN